jgi:hypothetical protein
MNRLTVNIDLGAVLFEQRCDERVLRESHGLSL